MSCCEKCWNDAGIIARSTGESKAEVYHRLLKERENNPCSPEEQSGEFNMPNFAEEV